MTRYRKKPVEVEAWQVGSDEPMPEWITKQPFEFGGKMLDAYVLKDDRKHVYNIQRGDFVVRDSTGAISVVSPESFEQTYEAVNDAED